MKKSTYKFNGRQRLLLALLCVGLLTGISFLVNYKTRAESGKDNLQSQKNNYALKSFSVPRRESLSAVNISERTSVWLKLEQGKPLDTTFYGRDAAISALQSNLAEATSQVSADINADGYPDLVSGFRNAAGGGLIALHRASRQAFEPTDKQVLADLRKDIFPATFEKDALILDVPSVPDFIFAGKFSEDSAVDLVFASRGGSSIYLMTSDGKGGFNAPQEIAVKGEITALASDRLDASKIYSGLAVALRGGKSSNISVFDGTTELVKAAPRKFQIKGDVNSLILANPDGTAQSKDIFGLADGGIFTIHGIGNPNSAISKIELPFRAADIAVGEFIRDRQAKAEIAVLSEDGNVSYLTRGTLDTRPFTTAEVVEQWQQNGGRGRGALTTKRTTKYLSDDWSVAETHQIGVYSLDGNSSGGSSPSRVLQKAYITGNETEDLLVTDSQNKRVRILFKEPNTDENKSSFTGETEFQNVDFADAPATVLPMRLNVMGQQGFVYFSKGSLEPIPVMAAPNVTFVVSKTSDTNDGTCNADCSLREAVIAANNAGGPDMITFAPNGTHQLTIDNAGVENAALEGDLDITQALTIVGNGTANTILQAGTTTANGIDKVLSINPNFNAAFATSFTGFRVRFGRNPSTFLVDGFGGGFDWEASGSGTLTVSGLTVDSNSTLDGDGGGIVATSFPVGSGVVSITNSTISNNDPDRTGANSPIGGGIYVGTGVTFRLTNTTLSTNNVVEGNNQGQGGGLYAFGPASSAGKSFLTGSTVSGNTAPSDGGGILSTQPIDFNSPTIISNNSSGRNGGGIWVNHTNGTTTISKATMTGNSAAATGGAMYLGSATTANILNVSFSRIVGNTGGGFRGLAVDAGTANVENNWWGCNTGPSAAPCDTAGVSGGGSVDFDPWLRFTHFASPTTIVVGQTSTLTASFLTNSNNQAIAASNLTVFNGVTATFNSPVRGTISGSPSSFSNGIATATFTGTSVGAGSANATVDSSTVMANLTIGIANTTTTITSDNPDPSVFGATITVAYTVAPQFGGTPTGNVVITISGGTETCTGTVAAGQCTLALTNLGARTLTATYAGDANFNGSSDTEPHQVNKADTTTMINSNTPNPSMQNTPVTVTYSVAVTAPGAGTPTGTVTVSDGVNNCTASVAAGSCVINLTTAGMRTLTATYNGDANFNSSTSVGVSQTVTVVTAAPVEISGWVTTQAGQGLNNAQVTITNRFGNRTTVNTNESGYFRFTDIPSGETYIISVSLTGYSFASGVLNITEDVTDLRIVAQ